MGDVLSQRMTGDSWNPMRSLELGAFGFLIDGPLRHLLSQLSADNTAVEMAGKVSSKVHAVLDGKASWVPLLACVVFAALKAADGDPAALLHSCEVCVHLQFCFFCCAFSCLTAPTGYCCTQVGLFLGCLYVFPLDLQVIHSH